jgi:acetoin utilization deacetylase AcuC-like enzyme
MLKIAWSEIYHHPLPENHRFPMVKYSLLPEQLIYEGTISEKQLFSPSALPEKAVLRTHQEEYWSKLKNLQLSKQEERRTGFPLSASLIEREITIMNGTVEAARYAFQYGISMNIAGGTHHAFTNRGEGFCLLNDLAIAAKEMQHEGLAERCLIVDLDVHQGNGSAEIFKNDDSVFTFSMHGESNYPMYKEVSSLDIGLRDGIEDDEYLSLLDANLPKIIDQFQPDIILYQCGVDVLKSDKLGRLSLSLEGCKQRDKRVLNLARTNKIPLVAAMGGGYSEDIKTIIEAHANTFRLATEIYF